MTGRRGTLQQHGSTHKPGPLFRPLLAPVRGTDIKQTSSRYVNPTTILVQLHGNSNAWKPSEFNTATIRSRSCGIASKEAMKCDIKIYYGTPAPAALIWRKRRTFDRHQSVRRRAQLIDLVRLQAGGLCPPRAVLAPPTGKTLLIAKTHVRHHPH